MVLLARGVTRDAFNIRFLLGEIVQGKVARVREVRGGDTEKKTNLKPVNSYTQKYC